MAHAALEIDAAGDYMTGQKAGTCYFKGPLKGMRYTLRRLGLSVEQFKQLWAHVRIESVAQMAQQLCQPDRVVHYDAVLSTDMLIAEGMCRAASQIVVREAAKASVLPAVLDGCTRPPRCLDTRHSKHSRPQQPCRLQQH